MIISQQLTAALPVSPRDVWRDFSMRVCVKKSTIKFPFDACRTHTISINIHVIQWQIWGGAGDGWISSLGYFRPIILYCILVFLMPIVRAKNNITIEIFFTHTLKSFLWWIFRSAPWHHHLCTFYRYLLSIRYLPLRLNQSHLGCVVARRLRVFRRPVHYSNVFKLEPLPTFDGDSPTVP